MSNTSEAMMNARLLAGYSGRPMKIRHWLRQAAKHLQQDIVIPSHIALHVRVGPLLVMECEKCGSAVTVDSVAAAADFRDWHYYCGQDTVPAWRCPTCAHWVFGFNQHCPFCTTDICGSGADSMMVDPVTVLDQYVLYDIMLPGKVWRASIKCNSLLRARRAARAMYPREEAMVRCEFGQWDAAS